MLNVTDVVGINKSNLGYKCNNKKQKCIDQVESPLPTSPMFQYVMIIFLF